MNDVVAGAIGVGVVSVVTGLVGLGAARWARARGRRPWAWAVVAIGVYMALATAWEVVQVYVK